MLFLERDSTILDMCQGVLNFLFFSKQLKHAVNTYSNIGEPSINPTDILIVPEKQAMVYIKSHVFTENDVTGIIQPCSVLEDKDDLIICPALTTT